MSLALALPAPAPEPGVGGRPPRSQRPRLSPPPSSRTLYGEVHSAATTLELPNVAHSHQGPQSSSVVQSLPLARATDLMMADGALGIAVPHPSVATDSMVSAPSRPNPTPSQTREQRSAAVQNREARSAAVQNREARSAAATDTLRTIAAQTARTIPLQTLTVPPVAPGPRHLPQRRKQSQRQRPTRVGKLFQSLLYCSAGLLLGGILATRWVTAEPPQFSKEHTLVSDQMFQAELGAAQQARNWTQVAASAQRVLNDPTLPREMKDVAHDALDGAAQEQQNQIIYDRFLDAHARRAYDASVLLYSELPQDSIYHRIGAARYQEMQAGFIRSHLERATSSLQGPDPGRGCREAQPHLDAILAIDHGAALIPQVQPVLAALRARCPAVAPSVPQVPPGSAARGSVPAGNTTLASAAPAHPAQRSAQPSLPPGAPSPVATQGASNTASATADNAQQSPPSTAPPAPIDAPPASADDPPADVK